MNDRVCAVIVTYHPDESFPRHLEALRGQVGALVVIDNRSDDAERDRLRELARQYSIALIENDDNLGIGTALNQGVRWAIERNAFDYVALFDQDSEVTEGFITTILGAYEFHSQHEQVAIFVPGYVDSRLGHELPASYDTNGNLATAMTSGSIIPLAIFTRHGYFEEDLFIGGVDFEFSLRMRSLGYCIKECKKTVLLHAPCDPRVHRLLGMRMFQTSNYSPLRRYYSERNRVWIRRKYRKIFPSYCLWLDYSSFKDWIKILLGEADKRAKFAAIYAGIRDGRRGLMGKNTSLDYGR